MHRRAQSRTIACRLNIALVLFDQVAGDRQSETEATVATAESDADEPVFYNDGFYWLYRDGVWLRSSSYRGGYIAVDAYHVPQRVRVIERPHAYVHYGRHHAPIVIRDHRHHY